MRASGRRAGAADLHAAIGRQVLVASFTGVEALALGVWLEVVLGARAVSLATAIGFGALVLGLLFEHVLADLTVNGLDPSLPLPSVIAVSVSEAVLWAIWLAIALGLGGTDGLLIAGGVLAALLVPLHSVEDNALRGRGLLSNVVRPGTIGFSLVEAAGATTWLLLVTRGGSIEPLLVAVGPTGVHAADLGLVALAVALFVEHNLGVAFARRS